MTTLKEEVNRKGLDALAMIEGDYTNGNITKDTYVYCIKVMHEAFAGIAGGDFLDVMNIMLAKNDPEKLVYESNNKKYLVELNKQTLTVWERVGNKSGCKLKKDIGGNFDYNNAKIMFDRIVGKLEQNERNT